MKVINTLVMVLLCPILIEAQSPEMLLEQLSFDSLKPVSLRGGQVDLMAIQGGAAIVGNAIYTKPYYMSEGQIMLDILKVPLIINYRISDIGFKGGRGNKFNVRFDAAQYYKNKLRLNKLEDELSKVNVDSLLQVKQKIGQQLAYKIMLEHRDTLNQLIPGDTIPAFSGGSITALQPEVNMAVVTDSLNINMPDSLGSVPSSSKDELMMQYQEIDEKIKSIQRIQARRELLQQIEIPQPGSLRSMIKLQRIRQFQIGTSSPFLSEPILSGVRYMGVFLSSESETIHFDLAAGVLQPQYQGLYDTGTNNPLSQFRNMIEARNGRLMAVRVGYGKLESSHIYVSGLKGRDNFVASDQNLRNSTNGSIEGQIVFKGLRITSEIARRFETESVNIADDSQTQTQNSVAQIALANAISYEFKKINTSLSGQYKWNGPDYYSIGNPFLRSDNAQYGFRVQNSSWKYLQPAVAHQTTHNNVLGNFNYRTDFTYTNFEVTSRPFQCLLIKANYGPARVVSKQEGSSITTTSSVKGLQISFMKHFKKSQYLLQTSYNRVGQVWDSLFFWSDNASITAQYGFNSKFTVGYSAQYILFTGTDSSTVGPIYIGTCTLGLLTTNQWNLQVAYSHGIHQNILNHGGYVDITKALGKSILLGIRSEKFVAWPGQQTQWPAALNNPYFHQIKLSYLFQ